MTNTEIERAKGIDHDNKCGYREIICIYPGIKLWMRENDMNLRTLAEKIGVNKATLGLNFRGLTEMSMFTIRRILEITGLTFEQAFGKMKTPQEARQEHELQRT